MSGTPTPPIVVEPWAATAVPPYITLPIPVPSQTGITPGKASFTDGFPPLNMTNPSLGGIPPSGADMNGILYTLSAWAAFLQAGQWIGFDAAAATAFGGYKQGAIVFVPAVGLDAGSYYQSVTNGNTDDPFSDVGNWRNLSHPLYEAVAPAAGTYNDYDVFPGPSDYAIDINTAAGNV